MGKKNKLIEIIDTIDEVIDAIDRQTIRRLLFFVFTIFLFIEIIWTFRCWAKGVEMNNVWLGILTVQFGAWGTMITHYFKENGKRRE